MPPLAVRRLDDGLIVILLPDVVTCGIMVEMVTGLPEAGLSVIDPELPFTTASLNDNTMLVVATTPALPCAGLYVVIVGAMVSAVVKLYTVPEIPA
jgi:hypothetical protein